MVLAISLQAEIMVFVEISSVCNYLEVILNTDLTVHVFGTTYSCIPQLL